MNIPKDSKSLENQLRGRVAAHCLLQDSYRSANLLRACIAQKTQGNMKILSIDPFDFLSLQNIFKLSDTVHHLILRLNFHGYKCSLHPNRKKMNKFIS